MTTLRFTTLANILMAAVIPFAALASFGHLAA